MVHPTRLAGLAIRGSSAVSSKMSTATGKVIKFGPFEVTDQVWLAQNRELLVPACQGLTGKREKCVFYKSTHAYALVNIKPILPGHVLVIPYRAVPRLTDLTTDELTDVFVTVQKVQKMLASVYFTAAFSATRPPWETSSRAGQTAVREDHQGQDADAKPLESPVAAHGSFNIAIQDGQDAGQTVAHVHCHIIPRRRADADGVQGDRVYNLLQGEQGNVGGGFYDRERPVQKGKFPKIEEDSRMPRERDDMNREAAYYAARMERCQL